MWGKVIIILKPARESLKYRLSVPDVIHILPEAHRHSTSIAQPGYTGRKRGEVVYSRAILQHAGSGLWLDLPTERVEHHQLLRVGPGGTDTPLQERRKVYEHIEDLVATL